MKMAVWPGLLLVALCMVIAGCGGKSPQNAAAQAPPPTVEITQVVAADTDIYVEYPGQTYARNMVDVRGRVEGYVEKWLFRPGQDVAAGQPLYVLDLRPFQAQLQQAQGTLKQTEADLDFAQHQVSLRQAEAMLATARTNQVKAQQDYDRLKPLVDQDAAAKQDLDAAVAALGAAESSVRANQANVEQARLSTSTQIASTRGKMEAQRGTLETAKLNVQYGTIVAPISGRIGDTQVPVGGLVNPNAAQPLTTIVPLDSIWVRFKVSEAQYLALIGKPKNGLKLELILADNSVYPQPGKVENALNQVDPRTGTLELQAEFPNPLHRLLPGQFGRIRYVGEHRTGAILIPQRAVQQNQSVQSVFTVGEGDKIQARPIKAGARIGESWLIEQGLNPGDRVVVEGLLSVRPGMAVHAIPYQDKATPSTQKKAD